MIFDREMGKNAAAQNHVRGLAPIRGSSPDQELRAEQIRHAKLLQIEALIAATRHSAADHERDGLFDGAANIRGQAAEMEQRVKGVRRQANARWWILRRRLSAEALLTLFGSA